MAHADRLYASVPLSERVKPVEELPIWSRGEVLKRHGQMVDGRIRVLLLIEGCVVDVGAYLDEHPGGAHLLLSHAVGSLPVASSSGNASSSSVSSDGLTSPSDSGYSSGGKDDVKLKDATKAFFGGMNNHSGAAKERMRCFRVARLEE